MKYKLKKDVLWYKAGTTFEKDDKGRVWREEMGGRIQTLDQLQLAIVEHMDDEDAGEYFEKINQQ